MWRENTSDNYTVPRNEDVLERKESGILRHGTQLDRPYMLDKSPLLHTSEGILQLLYPYFATPKQEIFDVNYFVLVKSFLVWWEG